MAVKQIRNCAFLLMLVVTVLAGARELKANSFFYCESEGVVGDNWDGYNCYTHCTDVASACASCGGSVNYCYDQGPGEVVAGCTCGSGQSWKFY